MQRRRRAIIGWLGLAGYIAVGVFPYSVSRVLVPEPAAYLLLALWAVGLVAVVRFRAPRPGLVALSAPAALVFWVLYVQAGSLLFGWSA